MGGSAVLLSTIRYSLATAPFRIGGRDLGLLAEWEVLVTLVVLGTASMAASMGALTVRGARAEFPDLNESHVAIAFGVLAALLFAGPAGTHIVRGVLDKARTLPPRGGRDGGAPLTGAGDEPPGLMAGESAIVTASGKPLDREEYRRGRIIGTIERWVLVLVVAAGHYEALAFLVAAKRFIRGNELKERNFAEYFLIGTLTSTLLALVVGLVVRWMVAAW